MSRGLLAQQNILSRKNEDVEVLRHRHEKICEQIFQCFLFNCVIILQLSAVNCPFRAAAVELVEQHLNLLMMQVKVYVSVSDEFGSRRL